jgi:NADH-quinone oxidoreductase subunit N
VQGFTEPIRFSSVIIPILPEILLTLLAFIVLALDLFWPASRRRGVGIVAGIGALSIAAATVIVSTQALASGYDTREAQLALGGMIRYDGLALVFRTIILIAGGFTSLLSLDVPKLGRQGEYYAIVLVATLGMSLMSAAADLIMVFVAIETTSISLYVLAGYLRDTPKSAEAGLKYYLFGAFIAGVFLYGLSLLYGFAGTTSIYGLAEPLRALMNTPVGIFALAVTVLLVVAGFGFKVAAVPFHFWAPDVYEGAPTPVTAFISTASKAASFALLLRVFTAIWPVEAQPIWVSVLAAISALTMTVGNLLALVQRNMKRLLAYSSIAHAGYTLMGIVALSDLGAAAVAFYMFLYVLTNLAAFAIVIVFSNATGKDDIADFAGFSRRSPFLSLMMVFALLSLGGIPPLAGFFGKFFLFSAAVNAGLIWLAVVGVLNAIVSLYYYLSIMKVMYVDPPEETTRIPVPAACAIVIAVTVIGILLMGTLSTPWFNWTASAATGLEGLAAVLVR